MIVTGGENYEMSSVHRGEELATERDFEAFFDHIFGRTKATVSRMRLSREDAEDVALDALAIAYRKWATVRELEYRDAWVLRVATNLAFRRVKRSALKRSLPIVLKSTDPAIEERLAVRQALARLPRRQREVVMLRYLADLREVEVAKILKVDLGTVKQHCSRGRSALHDILSQGEG